MYNSLFDGLVEVCLMKSENQIILLFKTIFKIVMVIKNMVIFNLKSRLLNSPTHTLITVKISILSERKI